MSDSIAFRIVRQYSTLNVNGRNLKDWSVNQLSVDIDLNAFSAGFYYLHITTERGSRTVQLVVIE